MQKTKWIAVLVLIGVFALSLAAIAQIPTTNWPRFQHDAYNSGRSPATTIAKPVLKWQRTLATDPACTTTAWTDISKCGIVVDPDGNVVVSCARPWALSKYTSTGTKVWDTTIPTLAAVGCKYTADGGPAAYGTNNSYYYLAGPGYSSSVSTLYMDGVDPSTGTALWSVNTGCILYTGTTLYERSSLSTPAAAPNGEVYTQICFGNSGDLNGRLCAINPLTPALDWRYGDATGSDGQFNGGAANEFGTGPMTGANIVIPMDFDGVTKNVIFRGGAWIYEWASTYYTTQYGHTSFMALVDNGPGVAPTKLWATNVGYHTSQPVMTSDGTKMYLSCRDLWYNNGNSPDHTCKELTSLNPLTGVINWQTDLPINPMFSPALGADGTLYLTGSALTTTGQVAFPSTNNGSLLRYNPTGRLVAVTDNGTSATVKWTLDMPAELGSDMSNAVVINTNPQVIYVAVGKGHVYCIEDLGDHAKILWGYNVNMNGNSFVNSGAYGTPAPASLALADDGTLYAGWGNQLLAFDTGYTTGQSYGIHGTVVDANGNPVAGAMVSVSTANHPLIDNTDSIYTTTNADGTYQVSVGGITSSTTYYVASWKEGCTGTDAQTVTLSSESSSATANFSLNAAKFNWALASTVSTNNADSSATYAASKAVDGDLSTWFKSNTASGYDITTVPTYLMADLGEDRPITEATVYWNYAYAKGYTIEYLPDGEDPATGTWTSVYSTTDGNGGYPVVWTSNALGNSYNSTAKGVNVMPWYAAADTVKFPATSARYWRVYGTVKSGNYSTVPTSSSYTYGNMGISEIALRDSTLAAQPFTVGGARNTPEGGGTIISSAIVTAVAGGGIATDTIFIEDANRTAGIKVHMTGMPTTIQFGDKVAVTGKVYTTTDGEKYIEAILVTRLTTTTCPDGPAIAELSMNNKAAADTVSQGLFIKTWGKVSDVDSTSFTISDGSASAIKVLCGTATKPADDDYVRVRGVVGKDANGPVLYMRNERADWAYDTDGIHALPFTGEFDYPIQYLVLGPFTDSGKTRTELLAEDFIGEANVGVTVMPAEGLTTAGKTWLKATSANGILNFLTAFGGTTDNSVAYAHLYVWSDTEAPTVALATGSDDALKYYVNGGTEVFSIDAARGCTIGTDTNNITLHQGLNSILFKVVNGTGAFALSSQCIDGSFITGTTGYGGYLPYTTTSLGYSLNPATP